TMLGPEVLDSERYSEILFRSTSVEPAGADRWKVRGDLTLHGQTHPVAVDVTRKDGHYLGYAVLKQTAFGIKPVSIAGGTIRVKDDVKVEFDIVMAATQAVISRPSAVVISSESPCLVDTH